MEATAEVKLNAEGFVSGAEKVKRASHEMERETADSAERIGRSMKTVERSGIEAGERVSSGARSISMALRATTGEAGALRFALIELAQSAKLSTAGIIGIGAGAEVLERVGSALADTIAKTAALKEKLQISLRPDASQGQAGAPEMWQRVKELDSAIAESAPKVTAYERLWQRVSDNTGASLKQLEMLAAGNFEGYANSMDRFSRIKGNEKGSVQNDHLRTEAESRRASYYEQIAGQEREANDLRERGTQIGEKAIRVSQIELETRQKLAAVEEQLGIAQLKTQMQQVSADPTVNASVRAARLKQLQSELTSKQKAAAPLQTEVRRTSDIQERVATQDYNSDVAQRATRSFDNMKKAESLRDVTPADIARFGEVDSVRRLQERANNDQNDYQQRKVGKLDTSEAGPRAAESDNALREEVQRLKDRGALLDNQTKVLDYQQNGQRALAAYTLKDFQNRQQVTQELRAGNKEFAAQLQIQQDISSVEERAAAFRESQNTALKTQAARVNARDAVDAKRFYDNGLTHDASRSGSLIPDANGPGGSGIPDAGQTGGSAAHALDLIGDNRSIPNLPSIANYRGTANMFDRTSANRTLGKAHWARETMERHRGDAAHDPARRLDDAPVFRTKAQMRDDQAHQFDRRFGGKNVSEENRPKAAPNPQPDQSMAQMLGVLTGIRASIAGLAAKIGTA